ncbi:hypothetical protein QTP86_011945, partial [Hemibagrus guttatus]
MAAELGGYKQAHPSPPPLTMGHSRVEEGPTSLKELGSRAQAVRGGKSDYLYPVPLNLPHQLRLLPPSEVTFHVPKARFFVQGGGPTTLLQAVHGRVPLAKTRPPGTHLRAPTPGLVPGWGLSDANPGDDQGSTWSSAGSMPRPEVQHKDPQNPLSRNLLQEAINQDEGYFSDYIPPARDAIIIITTSKYVLYILIGAVVIIVGTYGITSHLIKDLLHDLAGGLRASTSSQGSGLLTNALVGLAAVVGFLFIVFFILIIKRIFFEKATDDEESDPEECAAYENKALEEEETPHTDEAKTTNLSSAVIQSEPFLRWRILRNPASFSADLKVTERSISVVMSGLKNNGSSHSHWS